jgi:uncharacterized protein (DUF433 family)
MSKEYIEQREGGYYITGKRISLDSVVYAFRRGAAPESILRSFPLLTLEEIYGAEEYEQQRQAARAADPKFYKRMEAAKANLY